MNLRSLARCPTSVQLIHGALYGLAFETCSKTHFKVLLRSLGGLPKCAMIAGTDLLENVELEILMYDKVLQMVFSEMKNS